MRFRKTVVLGALVAGAVFLPGCRSLFGSSAADGAALGALLGAGGGYAIGHHKGKTTNYALGGALAGAMAGWIVGDQIDDRRAPPAGPETIRGSADDVYRSRPAPYDRVIVRDECDPLPPGW